METSESWDSIPIYWTNDVKNDPERRIEWMTKEDRS